MCVCVEGGRQHARMHTDADADAHPHVYTSMFHTHATPLQDHMTVRSGFLVPGSGFRHPHAQDHMTVSTGFRVASDTNNVLDVSDAYATQYGAPIAGRKIFGRFKEVNSSGMQGPDLILQVPVVASSLTVTPTTTNAISGTVVSTIAGSGTAVQELWQEVGVPGQFELFDEEAGVAGVATFVAATPGSRTFTRQHTGSEYGPRSEVFTAF